MNDNYSILPKGITKDELRTMPIAIVVSGGVESASLVSILAQHFMTVYPIYVRFGLAWEKIELQFLINYLAATKQANIEHLKIFDTPINNIYAKDWSITGHNVPDANTDDSAVYLPGRNLLLLTQTSVWCALNEIHFIALGSLGTNPFPDASPKFFDQLQNTLSIGLDFNINILRPFNEMHKHEVILLAKDFPLHLTFSCINPIIDKDKAVISPNDIKASHCGVCNKCAERQKAFAEAGIEDRTEYASVNGKSLLFS